MRQGDIAGRLLTTVRAYETVSTAKSGIGRYLDFYNRRRPHSGLDGKTPDAFNFANLPAFEQAA